MITLKLKIKSVDNSELLNKCISDYTHAFYKLYNNFELSTDKVFIDTIKSDFCVYTINCLNINVKTKLKQFETSQKKQRELLQKSEQELINFKSDTIFQKRRKFKLIKKIAEIKRNFGKNICFGGKNLLREITKLKQDIKLEFLSNKKLITKQNLLDIKLEEFKNARKIPILIIGQEAAKGNRKFNFDLTNNKLTYFFNKDNKINVEFVDYKNQNKVLKQLQKLTDNCQIPLTVSLSNDHVYLTYDESKLSGLSFPKNALKREFKKSTSKEENKQIYINFKKQHDLFLSKFKVKNRIAGIDLNPNHIGFNIIDFNSNKVLVNKCYDLTILNQNTRLSSENNTYQTNKRKYELIHIYKDIFEKCKHFKVEKFSLEDLEFKDKINTENREFNRQVKNIWGRDLQTNQVKKHCNIQGIKLELVNPMFSSFQGNLIFSDFDPIASSKIISERGLNNYKKGYSILGNFERINQEKLNYLLGENISKISDCTNFKNWFQLYKIIGKLPYRNKVVTQSKNFKNRKSKILEVI